MISSGTKLHPCSFTPTDQLRSRTFWETQTDQSRERVQSFSLCLVRLTPLWPGRVDSSVYHLVASCIFTLLTTIYSASLSQCVARLIIQLWKYMQKKTKMRPEGGEMNVGCEVISAILGQMSAGLLCDKERAISLPPIAAAMVTEKYRGGESEASDNAQNWTWALQPHVACVVLNCPYRYVQVTWLWIGQIRWRLL